MTTGLSRVFLFPGQGDLVGTPLSLAIARAEGLSAAQEVFTDVDQHAREFGMSTAGWWDHPALTSNQVLPEGTPQLVMFATSVALHRVLVGQQTHPDAFAGCSFGEIAAYVAAGAWSLADGVRAVCELVRVLRPDDGTGGMLLLRENADTTQRILEWLAASHVVVSCRNGPRQTLISGPPGELDIVAKAVEDLGIRVTQLPMVRCLSHHPEAGATAGRYRERLEPLAQSFFRAPVFSPCAGRWYCDADDLRNCLADNLCRPVDFTNALRELALCNVDCFVECGPPGGLIQAAADTLPYACVHSPLAASNRPRMCAVSLQKGEEGCRL